MRAVVLFAAAISAADVHWDYSSPHTWYALSPSFAECRMHRQSPIELKDDQAEAEQEGFLKIWTPRIPPRQVTVRNNGHSLTIFARQLGITLTGGHLWSQYTLEQIQYHAPSEHVIDGVRYPLERHSMFVPSDWSELNNAGQTRYPLVVIAEVFELNQERPDPQITNLTNGGLSSALTEGTSLSVNFLPRFDLTVDEFYTYEGSLTTPPCSEVVQWHVAKRPRTANEDQLQLFFDLTDGMNDAAPGGMPPPAVRYPMPPRGNARPLQPTNGRPVLSRRFFSTD
eukprot:Hpha_TRINITY_DN5729_c0_g1::TRINITY_DN5729_c0_g1_i1::g.147484::m.147484/K01674/cah; carbonic anhydrase